MPSQQEVKWSQLKVGIIVLVSVVVLTTLLFLMTSSSGLGFFSKKLIITTYFENAAGLKIGAPVSLEGVTIGTVQAINVSTDPKHKLAPVQVIMKIDGKFQPSLHTDSTAALTTIGVLGDGVVDISSQVAHGPMLQSGAELHTLETPSIQDVVKSSQGTIEQMNAILAKLNTLVDNLESGKGSVGQLLVNPDLYNKFDAAADDVHKLTTEMVSPNNSVGKLVNDHGQMYDRLNDILTKTDQIAADLQAGKGTLGKALKDPAAYNDAEASLASLRAILADAQAGKGGVGMMLKDPVFAQKLNDAVAKTDDLLTSVDQGQGTVGKLMKDDAAYTNLNHLLTQSTDLVTAIRKDPKKYLTIHMKIF